MTVTYIDTYVSGPVQADLELFARNFVNFVPVKQGRAAVAAGTDEFGNPTPAIPAAGDPALFYTLIRATIDITPLIAAPFSKVDPATGQSVVGVFA